MTIAETLRNLRKQRGITLQDLAERANSSIKTISQVENGKQEATIALMNKLLDAMGYELCIRDKQTHFPV